MRKTARINPLTEVEQDIIDIVAKQNKVTTLEADIKEHRARITDAMASGGWASASPEIDGDTYRITYVESSSTVIDQDKLKKRLGIALWNKVSTRVLDKKKLEAYLASGEIKTTAVAACSDEIPRTTFSKVVKK